MRHQFFIALMIASSTRALADGLPPGGQEPSRAVSLSKVPGAPVVIDSAYVDVVGGSSADHRTSNVSCVRYRNVDAKTIVAVRFERTYFDPARKRIGSDFVEDRTRREPNANAKPGTVPLAKAYWACTRTANPFGASYRSVSIRPTLVTFASGKTWRRR